MLTFFIFIFSFYLESSSVPAQEATDSSPSTSASTTASTTANNPLDCIMTCREGFKCILCGIKKPIKANVLVHIKLVHFKEKLFQCTNCKKNFSTNGNLNNHRKRCALKT